MFRVLTTTGAVALYASMSPQLWAPSWNSNASNTFWITFDGGSGARGSLGKFLRSAGKAITQVNVTIDPDNVLYSVAVNATGEQDVARASVCGGDGFDWAVKRALLL